MPITARTRVLGLVGHPVRQSLSPAMYNALLPRFGLDAIYVALDVDPERAHEVAQAVRCLDLVGINLTVPFKEAVLPHLDHITVAAQEAGAANVVVNVESVLTGYNTDGEGLVRSLEAEPGGYAFAGIAAAVVGTGGTGRAVASALLERGAARVVLLNRTVERAELAAEALAAGYPQAALEVAPLDPREFARRCSEVTLCVNCTAGDGAPAVARLDPQVLPDGATWVDVNYWMADPPHHHLARDPRLHFRTGHAMLAHQGALAFELFTGHAIRVADILELLEANPIPEAPW